MVDYGEARSRIPDVLAAMGANVEVTRLSAGDYDLGRGVLVERKTVHDLHESIHCGRFWPQLGRLRRASRHPYLLVEGADIDGGRLGDNAVRGACLAVIEQGVCLIRSSGRADTVRWLLLLTRRVQRGCVPRRDRPTYAQLLKRRPGAVPEALLCAIPGVSVGTARLLLREFGCVGAVCGASDDELLAVAGIGEKRLRAIREAFA